MVKPNAQKVYFCSVYDIDSIKYNIVTVAAIYVVTRSKIDKFSLVCI